VCRLFGFRSAVPSRAHRSLVDAENALSLQAARHPDGWGIGYFLGEDAYVIKASSAAYGSEAFRRTTERLTSHTFLVHVRRATVGSVDPLNTHPFRLGQWLFAHNGTIVDFEATRPFLRARTDEHLAALVLGDTDSEHVFVYLLSALRRAGLDQAQGRDAREVGRVVRGALLELDDAAGEVGQDRPLLNVLMTDGRIFVAHRAGMPLWMSTQKHFCAEVDTCPQEPKTCLDLARPTGGPVSHLVVASEPIAADENRWEDLPDGTTVVLDERFRLHVTTPPPAWVAPVLPEHLRLPPEPVSAAR
jgi:predicted glutamine amidotransferase